VTLYQRPKPCATTANDPHPIPPTFSTDFSQFPAGDIDAIYGAVNTFGGQHRRFATKEITHMICVQPTPQQFKTITETGLGIKIVLPEW
jgi:hypothetical protein